MTPLSVKDLLLAPRLDREQIAALLSPFGLKDVTKADANLQAMAGEPAERELLAQILEELLRCVSQSADPDQALTYLERFARAALHKMRLFSHLQDSPVSLEILARTMGGSPYMAEILIRDPQLFYWVADPEILHSTPPSRAIRYELLHTAKLLEDEQKPVTTFDGRKVINLASNNYLGLTIDPRVKEAAVAAIKQFGTGCSGSRYLTGTIKLHNQLEEELADEVGADGGHVEAERDLVFGRVVGLGRHGAHGSRRC